jgi:Flp pilus assembly protein TadG
MTRGELRSERGQATVEFAVVLPLVLLLVVGLIEFSKGFNYSISLNHLANEGARWAVVNRIPGDTTPATADVDELEAYVKSQINSEELSTTAQVSVCFDSMAGLTQPRIGDPVTVKVQTPYSLSLVSGVGDLAGSLFGSGDTEFGELTLAGQATMRFEQTPTGTDWSSNECTP